MSASMSSTFDLSGDVGETINFHLHGAMVWSRHVASIIKPDLAISLKRE